MNVSPCLAVFISGGVTAEADIEAAHKLSTGEQCAKVRALPLDPNSAQSNRLRIVCRGTRGRSPHPPPSHGHSIAFHLKVNVST
jgi:hypothetical protein